MRSSNNKAARALLPPIIVATGVVTAALALNLLVRHLHVTPHVGDIVAFLPSPSVHVDDDVRLLVHRPDQFGCVLDLNVLRRSGGSLILEGETSTETASFQAHWAGGRTSDDLASCGSKADLIVDRLDLDVLSLAASGDGIGPRTPPPFVNSNIDITN